MDKENHDPDFKSPAKKKKKALEKKGRFEKVSSTEEIESLSRGYVPANTQRSTEWAVRVFGEWRASRKDDSECPPDLFEKPSVEKLNFWLPRFVNEVRRVDGQPYPARTINQLLAGLQRKMLDHDYCFPKFMDRKNIQFRPIHGACDSVYHRLLTSGIGTTVASTSVIDKEEEDKLWSLGILGTDDPQSLQRAIFFYVGKRFCIRGGEEQRCLGPSQFIRYSDPDRFVYVEHGSKNRTGRANELRLKNKEVPYLATPESIPRCFVYLMDLYLSKLPKSAFDKDILYMRPKKAAPSDKDSPWYENLPVGKNTLSSMVKDMFTEAGILGKRNHSLRATGASAMFQSGMPERI